jgi:hypothetical protein
MQSSFAGAFAAASLGDYTLFAEITSNQAADWLQMPISGPFLDRDTGSEYNPPAFLGSSIGRAGGC